MRARNRFVMTLLLGGGAALSAQTNLLLPAAATSSDLNSSVAYPFDSAPVRVLYVISAQHFTGAGVTGPIVLQSLRARANGSAAGRWDGSTISNLRIDLSTAPHPYTSTSATFAANHGPNRVTVYQGAVTVAAVNIPVAPMRGPTYVDITFSVPFLYDPVRGGDLTLDMVSSGVFDTSRTLPQDASSIAGTALAKRVHSTTPTAPTGTLTTGEFCGVFGFTFIDDEFDVAFTGSPLTGESRTVNFYDQSSSTAPGGIVAWEWDLDGDGLYDSTTQNPQHYYFATCSAYTVTLRVRDGWNRVRTLSKPDYVKVGLPVVRFTWTPQDPPNQIYFTNMSSSSTGTWAWDFDGDGVTDSTVRSPGFWTYPQVGEFYQVQLQATLPCGPSWQNAYVLTSRQTGAAVASTAWWSYFGDTVFADLEVAAPGGVFLTAVSQFWHNAAGSMGLGMELQLTDSTWNGRQGNPSAWWTLATIPGGPMLAPDTATLPLYTMAIGGLGNPGVYLPQGHYGLALRMAAPPTAYLPDRATAWNWAMSNLVRVTNTRRGSLGTTATETDAWSGRLHFVLASDRQVAGYSRIGAGCPGPLGEPRLWTSALPAVGQTLTLHYDRLPVGAAFPVLGFSSTTSSLGPLPLELGLYGMSGCSLRVSLESVELLMAPAGQTTASWSLPIPNGPILIGVAFYNQALVLAPGWNLFGGVVSQAWGGVIGG